MRKLSLTLFFLGLALTASAQMMPDSTVQVIAYWEVGDKFNFQVEESKYTVRNGTDTSSVARSAHILTLEVVDATDHSYRLRAKTDDYMNSDYQRDAMTEEIVQQFGNLPFEFETDEYGVFERILISDRDIENIYPVLDAVTEKTAELQGLDGDALLTMKQLMRTIFTKEKIESMFQEEVSPLLSMHGIRLTPGEMTEYESEMPSLIENGDVIATKGVFWADEELTDAYSVVLYNELVADEKELQKYVSSYLEYLVDAVGDNTGGDARESLTAFMDNAEASLSESMVEEIHLDTGWPLHFVYSRVFRMSVGEMEQEVIQTKAIDIILDEYE